MMLRDPNYTDPLLGILPRIGDQALYDRVTGYGSAMWKAVGADEPARAMTASGHEAVYVYQFDWDQMPSNWLLDFKSLMGAGHGLEIPFVFYDIDNEMTYMPIDQIDKDNLALEALAGRGELHGFRYRCRRRYSDEPYRRGARRHLHGTGGGRRGPWRPGGRLPGLQNDIR
jgi:hypothetical protein